MIKRLWILSVILPCIFQPWSVEAQTLVDADELNTKCSFEAEKSLLTGLLEQNGAEKQEIYWRLARADYRIGEAGKMRNENKNKLLEIFKEGEGYADKALELKPDSADAFYWKASNLGLWTELKGAIEGLININPLRELVLKALTFDPEHCDAYFYLGQLYSEVPGWPIGYGNIEYAVSLARKGIWLYEKKYPAVSAAEKIYTYYVKLARNLIKRNWSASWRQKSLGGIKKKYESETDNFKKSCYFEGSLTLDNISDKEEARGILTAVQKELKDQPLLTSLQEASLKEAEELLKPLK